MQELLGLAVAVTVMLAALAAIGKAGHIAWRTTQKVVRLVDDLNGEPPGPGNPDGSPGLLQRLTAIEVAVASIPALLVRASALETRVSALEERTAAVEAQLQPNGGSTLRDSLDRVEAAVAPLRDEPTTQTP
jgi:hypothetical protein